MVRRRAAGALLLTILSSCMPVPSQVPSVISGHVRFPQPRFKTAYAASDLAAGAAVTLLQASTTIAAGITDANGDFQFTAPGTIDPNLVYKLIATKRLSDDGQHVSLVTAVKQRADGSWQSITQGAPVINATTTAVALVAQYQNVQLADTLDGVSSSEAGADPQVVNIPALNASLLSDVSADVELLVGQRIDPLRGVSYVDNAFSYGPVGVRAATAGATVLRITGFGFDPIAARNRVAFTVDGETVWASALSGSNENNLLVRVPPLPAPANGKGYQNVPFEVWNGANAVSLQQPGLDLFVYSPWRVPDTDIALPTDRTTSLGLTRYISVAAPLSASDNRLHMVWLDRRYLGTDYSPVYRLWDRGTDSLASIEPRASDPTQVSQAHDPAYTPFVFLDESNTDPTQHKAHVIWQGVYSGLTAIFHRVAKNGAWLTKGMTTAEPLGFVSGTGSQQAGAPSVAQVGNRLICAYLVQNQTSGSFNVQARYWDGYISSANAPDWSTNTGHASLHTIMINGTASQTASAPQICASIKDASHIVFHMLWLNYDPANPAGTQMLYRQGTPGTGVAISWNPTTLGPSTTPVVFESGPGSVQGLTTAADANNNYIVVWISGNTPQAKFIPFGVGVSLANLKNVAFETLSALPGDAAEATPQLIAISPENFYLITASKATNPNNPGLGGEIWLRRWFSGTWSRPVNISNSPGVLSENPSLHWNGRNLTATWVEGRTPVVLPIVPDI